MCKSVPSGFRTTQYPLGAAELGCLQNLDRWRFLLLRQCLIDQPYDGILCGRPRRGVAGFDGLVVQPDAPLPGMGSDALDDGVDLAAIFHMEPTAGNPDGSWRIFLNGMEPGARSSPAVNKVPAVSFRRQVSTTPSAPSAFQSRMADRQGTGSC